MLNANITRQQVKLLFNIKYSAIKWTLKTLKSKEKRFRCIKPWNRIRKIDTFFVLRHTDI